MSSVSYCAFTPLSSFSSSPTCTLESHALSAPPSDDAAASRFLMTSSFGPTTSAISSFITPTDYVTAQISLPVTSHRQHYRERTSVHRFSRSDSGGSLSPCDLHSRWHSHLFSEDDNDGAATFTYDSTSTILTVTSQLGTKQTEMPSTFTPCSTSGSAPYPFCYILNDGSTPLNLVYYGENCDCTMPNPPLVFQTATPPSNQILHSSATLSPLSPAVEGAATLTSTTTTTCIPPPTKSPVYAFDPVESQYFLHDPRLQYKENSLTNPSCEPTPKTFLNEHSCTVQTSSETCSPQTYTDTTFTLTDALVRKWFTLSGVPLHYVTGLRLDDQKVNWLGYSDAAVCASKRSTRWLVTAGACASPSSVDATTLAFLTDQLTTHYSSPDLLVEIPRADSSDDCDSSTAAGISITIGSSCYTHTHSHNYDVYDFSSWQSAHPGNEDSRTATPPNPNRIKAVSLTAGTAEFPFPTWHSMDKWQSNCATNFEPNLVGRLGDTMSFSSLPQFAQTPEMAAEVGASLTGAVADSALEICGSPYEVASVPSLGSRYTANMDTKDDAKYQWIASIDDYTENSNAQMEKKRNVWHTIAFSADDQLRQRVAWCLAQIFVISEAQVNRLRETELFQQYYDIFVRNAFGTYRDVLKEVSYSPMMGTMLTFLQSKSLAYSLGEGSELYPDENYAREIKQLFTIGLHQLNMDGTKKLDSNNNYIPTYTNLDIMSLARVWTGFDYQFGGRGNIENYSGDQSKNVIDPMQINFEWRDRFPKRALDGKFIGDGYPLCRDLPSQAFLKVGARYSYLGSSFKPRKQHYGFDEDESTDSSFAFTLDSSSPLYAKLAALQSEHELTENLQCFGAECSLETLKVVRVGNVYYEYLRIPCVEQAFVDNGFAHPITTEYRKDAICVDGRLPLASGGCCASNGMGTNVECSNMRFEKTSWATVQDRCAAESEAICTTTQKYFTTCAEYPLTQSEDEPNRFWMTASCSIQAQIYDDGAVGVVHKMLDEIGDGKEEEFKIDMVKQDSKNKFYVDWKDGNFLAPGVYEVTTTDVAVFSSVPLIEQVLEELKIGGYIHNDVYTLKETSSEGMQVWVDATNALNEWTVFKLPASAKLREGYGGYFRNVKSTVSTGSYEFPNPPSFMSLAEPTSRDAEYETEAALDHYMAHPNVPPFVADFFIKRFTTSNASPRYVEVVATAFTEGTYQDFGSGEYGDLCATIAAVLLDREATSWELESDPSAGKLREPVLKLMHMIRALELERKNGREVEFAGSRVQDALAMSIYEPATVFNFYQNDYSAGAAAIGGLLAPEAQLLMAPTILGWLNAALSMVEFGLSSCDSGVGVKASGTSCWKIRQGKDGWEDESLWSMGMLKYEAEAGEDEVDMLDLLLTGERMSPESKQIVKTQYDAHGGGGERSRRVAMELILASSEFHVEGQVGNVGEKRTEAAASSEEEEVITFDESEYKAVVTVFLNGACDSYNLLVPHSECNGGDGHDLQDQYQTVRTDVALTKAELLQIDVTNQPCDKFGVNPAIPFLKELYDDGDANFFANIGALVEPMTLEEWKADSKRVPPNLFAHNSQTVAASTVYADDMNSPGVLGKIQDALSVLQTSKKRTTSYSINGNQRILSGEAGVSPVPNFLNKNVGIIPFDQYGAHPWLKQPLLKMVANVSSGAMQETWGQMVSDGIMSSEELAANLESDGGLEQIFAASQGDDASILATQLEKVANVIAARSVLKPERDIFAVDLGGFDTHSNAKSDLTELLGQMDTAFTSFVAEMKLQGVWDKVTVVVISEFGRTLNSNGLGTDHGWAGNSFYFGGAVKGGNILGQYPTDLRSGMGTDVGNGRLIPTTPWEGLWHGIAQWLGVEDGAIMKRVMPNLENFEGTSEKLIYNAADMFE
ncbi:hypothetical protein TrST_g6936 [Triparma strigata]|uniref:DUF1501 domain-containing protein n=1 Tax=Triparma strigata TaxID=1606541 RepID=A0A9W7BJS1_9STRA|nr:hypothetical protein TrST_g6936 [Triparma strigata]